MTSLPSNEAVESASRVKVFIRVRPQNSIEAGKGGQVNAALKLDAKAGEVEVLDATEFTQGSQRRFTFDGVFTPESKQEDVFDAIGKPTVDRVLAGFNGTVLAYGQTSSGKTHTMMGPGGGAAEALRAEQRGITPRVLQHLMASLTALPEVEVSWTVQLSVCELYNEELFDLGLAPGEEGAGELRIREDRTSGRGVFVENLKTVSVKTAEEALQMMMKAAERKRVAATNANETSSRSHTIVQLLIEQVNNVDGGTKTSSQLFLVDLAGSERLSKAFSTSERVKEAQNINLSLTLLGNVINKLTDGKALHIPYRDSKLTRLVQDSLGGNAMTTLLCACSPSTFNAAETLSTLMFANRAKRIENRPRANKILSDDELRKAYIRALDEIRNLEDTVRTLRQLLTDSPSTATPPPLSARGRPLSGAPSRSIMRSPSQSKIPVNNNGSSTPPSQDDPQLQLDELRDAVRCLTLDLKDAREEVQRVDQCWSDAAKKVTFYQARDAKQRQLIAERDQRHADLATEIIKLQESLATAAAKPCVQCAAAAKKATSSSTVTIKAAPVATPARTSVSSKSFVKPSTSSQAPTAPAPATHRPLEVQAIVRIGGQRKVAVAEISTQTNEGTKAASAIPQAIVAPRPASEMSAAASQALLDSIKASASDREAFLLSLLEMMKNESGFLLKYKIIIERLNRELSFNEADTNRKLAKQSQVYESQNARQERRLRELQVQLAIALKNGKNDDYLEMLNDATEGKSLQVLQMENVHLQEDNREHMRQITRLSARVEALQSDLNRRILEAEGHIE